MSDQLDRVWVAVPNRDGPPSMWWPPPAAIVDSPSAPALIEAARQQGMIVHGPYVRENPEPAEARPLPPRVLRTQL